MASLTHVCMWSDNGWKRITAEQAARLHPVGTVSAHSGLFMCELCGQYVILTDGDIRIRYFKHSAYEKSKDCPERTFGAGYSISYGSQEHDLPIRITSVSSSSFSFEVGLIRAPISSLGKDFCIEIKPKGAFDIPYVYTKERLNYDSITYLPSPFMHPKDSTWAFCATPKNSTRLMEKLPLLKIALKYQYMNLLVATFCVWITV